jgi:methionine aminopeptidase
LFIVALRSILPEIQAGRDISELCEFGDRKIEELLSLRSFPKALKRGVAFPTSISVNEYVHHVALRPQESCDLDMAYSSPIKLILKAGDLVKVELGAHVDGYMARAGHSIVIPSVSGGTPVAGPIADAITSAHLITELAWRIVRPGTSSTQLLSEIQMLATAFKCSLIKGTYLTKLGRYVTDNGNDLYLACDKELGQQNTPFMFSPNEVYDIGIYVAAAPSSLSAFELESLYLNGTAVREGSMTPIIYQRNPKVRYPLRTTSGRKVFSHVVSNYDTLPFNSASLPSSFRLGLRECVTSGLLEPFPMNTTCNKSPVACFRFTLAILPNGNVVRLTPPNYDMMSHVQSGHVVPVELAPLLAQNPESILEAASFLPLQNNSLFAKSKVVKSKSGSRHRPQERDAMEIDA